MAVVVAVVGLLGRPVHLVRPRNNTVTRPIVGAVDAVEARIESAWAVDTVVVGELGELIHGYVI